MYQCIRDSYIYIIYTPSIVGGSFWFFRSQIRLRKRLYCSCALWLSPDSVTYPQYQDPILDRASVERFITVVAAAYTLASKRAAAVTHSHLEQAMAGCKVFIKEFLYIYHGLYSSMRYARQH